ncbi:Hypothetical predicted protein [Olea europaea subsp. europaea]|uniref:Uncharacterized protein n=1 Tax=Olea europaea subsp. europaea TaxID=158383 RepID=A0A8S0TYQ1_OLEEU|nr:Hypothetical predicted protein [Olea europaea subsp. europaea]
MGMLDRGQGFLKSTAFKFVYARKNKCCTYDVAEAQQDEILFKDYEYLVEKVKEQQLSEDTPLEEIYVEDPKNGVNIMMSILGSKPEHQIRGLGDGCHQEIEISSSSVHTTEEELEAKCAAQKVKYVTLAKIEHRMQNKTKVVK